jgi:hypothetical protein
MNGFPDVAVAASSMNSTGEQVVRRFTRYLLLAWFLRLQVACCCAAHRGAEPQEQFAPASSHVGSGCASLADVHDHPSGDCGHEHLDPRSSDSQHGHCHLCVLTHLQYMSGPHALACDQSAAAQVFWRLDDVVAPSRDGSLFVTSLIASADGSLLACGSMLRI